MASHPYRNQSIGVLNTQPSGSAPDMMNSTYLAEIAKAAWSYVDIGYVWNGIYPLIHENWIGEHIVQ
jgi:hypothetical protein